MLRSGGSGVSADEPDVLENSAKPEEQVDVDGENEAEETMEEEVEYEEVEEEEEVEEIEDEVEEEVEEEEIEEAADEADSKGGSNGVEEIDEERKHAELLALPPHGTEVYLGGIPPDASEEDLKEFCKFIGAVTEARIMKGKDSSESRGYAFVSFRTKELASKAIEEFNNTEGKKVKCSTYQANHKLFIGNVPRNWGEENIKKAVKKIGPGVNLVELLKDLQNPSRNRGFAFIEYYNHACAEYSRKKMSNPEFKLDDNAPTVSWADPRNAGSSAAFQSHKHSSRDHITFGDQTQYTLSDLEVVSSQRSQPSFFHVNKLLEGQKYPVYNIQYGTARMDLSNQQQLQAYYGTEQYLIPSHCSQKCSDH